MKILLFVIVTAVVFSLGYWTAKYQISMSVKEIVPEIPARKISQDTQWVGSDEFIIFDTAVVEVYRNTGFEKSFDDFKVPIYQGKKAPLKYGSSLIQKYDAIAYQYGQRERTFAGHYVLAEWMCGTPCQNSAVVDVLTGKIHEGVMALSGFKYKPNSKLLIVNSPDSLGWYKPMELFDGVPEYYIWENNRFKPLN